MKLWKPPSAFRRRRDVRRQDQLTLVVLVLTVILLAVIARCELSFL